MWYVAHVTVRAPRHRYAYSEYVTLEDSSSSKHEYFDGEIYAMAGGTPDHARLAANLIVALRAVLPPSCAVFTSDLRVRVVATGLSTYPDATVVCGKTERAVDDRYAVTNPILVAEVTSPSTEEYDRGEKMRHFRELSSVREILLVGHREPHVVVHRRGQDGAWLETTHLAGEEIRLDGIGGAIAVDAIFAGGLEDA